MKLGFIGLGRMGSRMVTKLFEEGHEVVVWNRSSSKIDDLKFKIEKFKFKSAIGNLKVGLSIRDLTGKLGKPRIIWLMLPAGEATEEILKEVDLYVEMGDVVIDGGNAHYTDTQRRYDDFSKKGVLFLGIGVSGGVIASRAGYSLMIGGKREAYEYIGPILDSLSKPGGGYEYFGEGGAGHFVKMVHNGIEYGIMQSIGEGFGVLEKSPYNFDLVKVSRLYQKGTLVSGFMMERTTEAFEADPKLAKLEGYIEASGEGQWTVVEAKKLKVPVEVIEKSLEFRTKSRKDPKIAATFAARMVAALRNVFGGHEVKRRN